MNTLDIIILIILLGFAIIGFFKGFIRAAFALAGLVLGIIAANIFYSIFGEFLQKYTANEDISNTLSYTIIFICVTIGMAILGRILNNFIKVEFLKRLDRILGLVLGFGKGLILVSIMVMVLGMTLPTQSTLLTKSQLKPYIESIYTFVPDDFLTKLQEKKKELEKYMQKK